MGMDSIGALAKCRVFQTLGHLYVISFTQVEANFDFRGHHIQQNRDRIQSQLL